MARSIPLVLTAQVRVRIDLQDAQVVVLPGRGADERRRQRMLASECDGELAVIEQRALRREDLRGDLVEGSIHGVDRWQSRDADPLEGLELEFLIVEFHVAACGQDCGRAISSSMLVR